ncbi:unnamed protein product [Phyllotreta striolata]|uniref:COMM domain-containing protein 3 n=1 Tax=Phyllotreta striolata TaxID=444603 RepID=A0A9N9TKV3_PHYSR|nr:unnamed protein product [Phyllotreta striolata]
MNILDEYKSRISRNIPLIADDTFKKLLENCFSYLTDKKEVHNTTDLYNSKPDVTKEVYAAFLAVTAEFVRSNLSNDEVAKYLQDCGLARNRIDLYLQQFVKERLSVEIALLNIGNTLPHITDVKWKIDYIVKSSEMDSADGPLFRICFVAEEFSETDGKALRNIHFTCNSVELLDLIYKLKDAVRHCSNLTHRLF